MGGRLKIGASRKRQRRAVLCMASPAHSLAGAADPSATGAAVLAAPRLLMQAPESLRSTFVAGSYTTVAHAALLALLLVAALLAPPELIERVIPVEIVRPDPPIELPGSNLEPAPAGPKAVGALRPSAAAMMGGPSLTAEQAEALRRAALEAARRAAQQMQLEADREQIALPAQVERREVHADSLAARAAAAASPSPLADTPDLHAAAIDPVELSALEIDTSGPRQIDTSELGDLSPAQALDILNEFGTPEYNGSIDPSSADLQGALRAHRSGSGVGRGSGSGVDTGVSGDFGGSGGGDGLGSGNGSGGTGTAVGVARCMESGYVQRYVSMLSERTFGRWDVPKGAPADAQVVLRFALDAAGMVGEIEVVSASNDALGDSARLALRSAAPFPPMDDNIRCLAGRSLISTFDVPSQ